VAKKNIPVPTGIWTLVTPELPALLTCLVACFFTSGDVLLPQNMAAYVKPKNHRRCVWPSNV